MLTTAFRQGFLDHLFLNSAVANIGDATGLRGASTAGSFYMSLHAAFPGLAGNQTSNEAAYTGYARKGVTRDSTGWTRSGIVISPTSHIEFNKCTGGSAESSYFAGLGTDSSGTGNLIAIAGLGPDPIPFFGADSGNTIYAPELVNQTPAWAVNDRIVFYAFTGIASLPTGITEGTIYFVKTLSGGTLTISATAGGAAIDLTADGAGLIQKLVGITATPPNTVPRIENTSRFILL